MKIILVESIIINKKFNMKKKLKATSTRRFIKFLQKKRRRKNVKKSRIRKKFKNIK